MRGVRCSLAILSNAIWLGSLCSAALAQSPYRVNGINLGDSIYNAPFLSRLKCEPSSQYLSYQWCTGRIDEPNQGLNITASVLHAQDGRTLYLNRFIVPAPFGPPEIDRELQRLTAQYRGQQPRLIRHGNSLIASWGAVTLTPLPPPSIQELAAGRPSGARGFLIDFLGNFRRSAEQGLPVFKLSGEGVAMSVNFDQGGNLRLAALDRALDFGSPPPVAALNNAPAFPQPQIGYTPSNSNNDPAPLAQRQPMRQAAQDAPLLNGPAQQPKADEENPSRSLQMAQSTGATSDGRTVQTVVAEGVGSDVESASKNAAENALKQVVGTFIDADQQIQKRSEISQGIRSEAKSIQSNMREYSQGTIQSFEVIGSSSDGPLVRVEAKVGVRVDDFKAYIKKLAQGEQAVGGGLFPEMATELDKQKNLEDLIFNKIEGSINKGEVQDIEVGAPQRFTASNLQSNPEVNSFIRQHEMNPAAIVVIPVAISLRPDFYQNMIKTLDSTAIDRFSIEARMAPYFASNCTSQRRFEYSVGIAQNRKLLDSDGKPPSGEFATVYGFSNVRSSVSSVEIFAKARKANNLRLSVVDRGGNSLKEFVFSESSTSSQKHFVFPTNNMNKIWNLIMYPTRSDCLTVIARSEFSLVVELDGDIVRNAAKTVVKLEASRG
jgi:hypothetical protein